MNARTARRLAWGLVGTTATLFALASVLDVLNASADISNEPEFPLLKVAFPLSVCVSSAAGALIASRHPNNAVGWLLCAAPVAFALTFVSEQYAAYALVTKSGSLPAGQEFAWLAGWLGITAFYPVVTFFFLLFPDGHLPSHRWRPVAWISVAAISALAVGVAFAPEQTDFYGQIENPFGLTGAAGAVMTSLQGIGWVAMTLATTASAGALIVRYRGARGDERVQIKWVAAAAGITIVSSFLSSVLWEAAAVLIGTLPVFMIPGAAAIAILKYRLYDIDVIINRTLVYGALTVALGLAYAGSVLLLRQVLAPVTAKSDLAVAGSTIAVAALFRPLRSRIQGFIDRRFYRSKYDAVLTLESFSSRLRDEVDLGALSSDLIGVVRETMQPVHTSLWLRPAAGDEGGRR